MNNLTIKEDLLEYVSRNVHSDNTKLTDETLLFREGIIDSMGFILLIEHLENKYNIKANDDDLVEENFESLKAIVSFINKKKTA